ncbi:MAG: sigma-54-dependent Fis family transcriptional regulator [Verrucomicrobia bacterium]|nr:sigma-54-dependent Fis family transcriptional regulator [Verrucomicrobiota bacterium]
MNAADPSLFKLADAKILVIDDVAANRKLLCDTLESHGYTISAAPSGEVGLKVAQADPPDLILLDVMMPGIDGYEVCRRLKAQDDLKELPVIFITANNETSSLVEGFRAGGVDYITKPFQAEEVLTRIANHLKLSRLTNELRAKNRALEEEVRRRRQAEDERDTADGRLSVLADRENARWDVSVFVGQSATFKGILETIRRLHRFSNASVLITGESGTGKELVARAIHFGGAHAEGPFIPVNCSAIPAELAESIFFGHVKGAFTGASSDRKGYFELANQGTLFLDEVGEMPVALQAKLLRVLEDGQVQRLGEAKPRLVQIRIVAASNVDFQECIAAGRFRRDLFFRLARFTIDVPPLRERTDDIPILARHFLKVLCQEMNVPTAELTEGALEALKAYSFPGNVRELKNLLERAVVECEGQPILAKHLHFFFSPEEAQRRTQNQCEEIGTLNDPIQPVDATPDEVRILRFVQAEGCINNTSCRELLKADRHRASYLLRKLEREGRLAVDGQGRWAQYRLPEARA